MTITAITITTTTTKTTTISQVSLTQFGQHYKARFLDKKNNNNKDDNINIIHNNKNNNKIKTKTTMFLVKIVQTPLKLLKRKILGPPECFDTPL